LLPPVRIGIGTIGPPLLSITDGDNPNKWDLSPPEVTSHSTLPHSTLPLSPPSPFEVASVTSEDTLPPPEVTSPIQMPIKQQIIGLLSPVPASLVVTVVVTVTLVTVTVVTVVVAVASRNGILGAPKKIEELPHLWGDRPNEGSIEPAARLQGSTSLLRAVPQSRCFVSSYSGRMSLFLFVFLV